LNHIFVYRSNRLRRKDSAHYSDFSIVLLQSDFVLFSEKNHVKALKNQWLLTMPYPLERLAGATGRGQTMAPEGQRPSQWRYLTKLPRAMYSQPIVHKALSRGTIRKSACILAEITIRKSQSIGFLPLWCYRTTFHGNCPVLSVYPKLRNNYGRDV